MFLPSNITLAPGDSGDFVTELQRRLGKAGVFPEESVSGFYDGMTTSAVTRFQTQNGLRADGIAGPETLRRLNGQLSGGSIWGSSDSTSSNAEEEAKRAEDVQKALYAAEHPEQAPYDPFLNAVAEQVATVTASAAAPASSPPQTFTPPAPAPEPVQPPPAAFTPPTPAAFVPPLPAEALRPPEPALAQQVPTPSPTEPPVFDPYAELKKGMGQKPQTAPGLQEQKQALNPPEPIQEKTMPPQAAALAQQPQQDAAFTPTPQQTQPSMAHQAEMAQAHKPETAKPPHSEMAKPPATPAPQQATPAPAPMAEPSMAEPAAEKPTLRQRLSGMVQKLANYFESKLSPSVLQEVQNIGQSLNKHGVKENPIPADTALPAPSQTPERAPQAPQQTKQ